MNAPLRILIGCECSGIVRRAEIHKASPGPNRAAERSRFFPGIAAAMAEQWGGYAVEAVAA